MSITALRDAAIARTRRAVESMMTDTVTILRNSSPVHTAGGSRANYQPHHTTRGLLTASILGGGREDVEAAQLVGIMTYTLAVPSGTDIEPADRVVRGGTTFEVQSIKRADTWGTSDSAILTEIQR